MVRKAAKKGRQKAKAVRKSVRAMLREQAAREENDWRLREESQHFTFNRVGDDDNPLLDTEREISAGIEELDDTDMGYDNGHLSTYSQGEDIEDMEEEGY